jgi:signal transduction histidine kinase
MRSLRETLAHLRPPEIDDLGLILSLQVLVADHNRRSGGKTRFDLHAEGRFDDLPAETAAHVYRIIQEGLNNAARHANAQSVHVSMVSSSDQRNLRHVELAVTDNGIAETPATSDSSGVGLVGIRERVYALSGTFAAQRLPSGGFELRVSFPVRRDLQEEAA